MQSVEKSKSLALKRLVCLLLGPILAIVVFTVMSSASEPVDFSARAMAAIVTLMAVWWMTEAIPLPATALLPIVLFPLIGVHQNEPNPLAATLEPYAHKMVFLFLGGFLIALAIEKWNLHRRIALSILLCVGTKPDQLIAGFMLATAGLSMWISNTATTLMMLPIAMSIVSLLINQTKRARATEAGVDKLPSTEGDQTDPNSSGDRAEAESADPNIRRFATCMMLCVAYAASIGGLSTFIGTPPNGVIKGYLDEIGRPIPFFTWMMFALPMSIVLLGLTWILLTKVVFRFKLDPLDGGRDLIRGELSKLGRVSRGEWSVIVVFLMTAGMWMFRQPLGNWDWLVSVCPPVGRLDDSIIAMAGGLVLFIIPVKLGKNEFALDWETATKLPWGILLLFGGGLSLAKAVGASGLGLVICGWVEQQDALSIVALIILVTVVIVFLTELTSNLATATLFVPILAEIAVGIQTPEGAGIDPLLLVIPAALAASCAFMLPVATPPNAIVFASGHISIRQMMKGGLVLNLVAICLIPITVYFLGPLILGLER